MGCVYSQRRHPMSRSQSTLSDGRKVFSVTNVDDSGQEVHDGKIEITAEELCLHQKGKNSIYWSLRSLRRYGFDSELFSFECGRRCQTGPGIYAFKCSQAEALFNALQEAIQQSTNHSSATTQAPPLSPPEVQPRLLNPGRHLYANSDPQSTLQTSVSAHSYVNSPFYVNVNTEHVGRDTCLPQTKTTDVNTNYAKLDDFLRFYVNVKPNQESPPPSPSEPQTCNYITLDLDSNTNSNQPIVVQTAPATPITKTPPQDFIIGQSPPQTPLGPPMSYAQIDFEKTSALSNSAANHRKGN